MIMSNFLWLHKVDAYQENRFMAALTLPSTSSPHIWLPLPTDLTISDSFADDLIRQFDKKRSSLHKDLEQDQEKQSQKSSSTTSCQPTPITPAPSSTPPVQPKSPPSPPRSTKNPRRTSAGELLRRSSEFFKTTLDSTWKNISRSDDNLCPRQDDQPTQVPFLPETIAIHTTITFPPVAKKPSNASSPPLPPLFLSPPVISQYPPKPLQYSPITVPAKAKSSSSSSPHKTLMHRLSLPALRHNANNQRPSDITNVPLFIKRKKSSQL